MLEMWKNTLHKGGYVSPIFMDLSKAFDTLNHNLIIAKLGAYGFERDSLSFMKSYLKDRQQRVRVNNSFSSWEKIIEYSDCFHLTFLSMIFLLLSQVLI